MNPATIFGFLTSTGVICLGFGTGGVFSIALLLITVISFFATLFFSVKTSTQNRILTRIIELPFPDWMTPQFWMTSAMVMGTMTILLALTLDHFELLGSSAIRLLSLFLVSAFFVVILYWGIVGAFRYFGNKD